MDVLFWAKLQQQVNDVAAAYPGVMGVALHDLARGHAVTANAGAAFPSASTIKIHVLTCMLAHAEQGLIDLDATVRVAPSAGVSGSGVLSYLDDPVELTWRNVVALMIALSDNTATNLCIDLCGLDAINRLIAEAGLAGTALHRKMSDVPAAETHDNETTPADLVAMLLRLHGGWPSPAVAARVLATLRKPKEDLITRAIGDGVPVANKPGRVPGSWSDAGLVMLPRRPYILALMTKFDPQQDDRRLVDLIRTIHAALVRLDQSNELGHAVYSYGV